MLRNHSGSSGIHDLFLTIGGRVGALLIAVLFQAILARTLGPEGRGSFEASILFGAFLFLIFNVGAEMSSLYLISSKRASISTGISNSLSYVTVVSFFAVSAGIALIFLSPNFLDGVFSKGSRSLFFIGLLIGFTTLFSQTLMAISTALKMFKVYSFMLITERIAGILSLIFLVVFLSTGTKGGLVSILISKLVIVAFTLVVYKKRLDFKWEFPQRLVLRELFSYGSRFYVGKLSNQVNLRIAPIILLLFATKNELGFFSQALAIAVHFMIVPDSLYMALLPRASEDSNGKVEVIAQAARINSVFSLLVLTGSLFFAKHFFQLVLSDAFLPSVPLFKILVLGFALRSLGKAYEPYLIGTNQPGKISFAIATGAIVNLILIFVLMPLYGLQGAAWSMVGNYGMSTILIIFSFVTTSEITFWKCIQPSKEDFKLVTSVFQKWAKN